MKSLAPRAMHTPARTVHSVAAAAAIVAVLSGCTSINDFVAGDKIDYRNASARTTALEVPPDLTQLSGDSRFLPPVRSSVTASSLQASAASNAAPTASTMVPMAVGAVRLERQGDQRWLSVPMPPEKLWPLLQTFWEERGLKLATDLPDVGVMETDWAENRAKLSSDLIRRTLGKVLDSLYSTSELDKYRMRLERTPTGSEIFITHKGKEEIYSGQFKDSTVWQSRARDPSLEVELLMRLMMKLGVKEDQAKVAATAAAPILPARARLITDRPAATLEVDDGFDRAWRRVGLALDRSGFTVEDRDRIQGIYFVRYVDPAKADKAEPGFFAKLLKLEDKTDKSLVRYRVSVKSEGELSTVTVADASGAPENGAAGQRIVKLLLEELK